MTLRPGPPAPPPRRKGDPGILIEGNPPNKDARAAAKAATRAAKESDARGLDANEPGAKGLGAKGPRSPGYRLRKRTMRDNGRISSEEHGPEDKKPEAFPSRFFKKLTGQDKDKKGTDSVASSDVDPKRGRRERGRSPDRPAREGARSLNFGVSDKHKRPYSPGPHTRRDRRDRYPEPEETPLGTNRARSSDEEGRIPLRRSPNNNGRREKIFPDSIPDPDAGFQIPGPVEDRPQRILQPSALTRYSLKELLTLNSYIQMDGPCKGCGESITPCLSCHRGWTWVQLASERLGRTVQSEEDLRCTECLQMVAMCEICNLPLSKVKVMRRHRSMKETNFKEYPLRR